MITSIPSWVNEKKENVSIVRSFGLAMPLSVTIFTFLGLFGGLAFDKFEHNSTILVVIYGLGSKVAKITFFLFPACVNLTSIPVFSIMQRYNLVTSGVCGHKMALFIAVLCPWLISIPLYTGSGYELLVTWSGILITSVVNFIVPPILYLLALRATAAQSARRASVRMMTGLRHTGLTAPRTESSHDMGGLATNSRFRARSMLELGAASNDASRLGAGVHSGVATGAVTPAAEHSVVDMPAPPMVDAEELAARKARSISRRREREKEQAKEKKEERAKKQREKRAAAKKKAKEAMVPDEAELPQPPLQPVLPWVPPMRWRDRVVWASMLPLSLAFHYSIPHPASFQARAGETESRLGRAKLVAWSVLSILVASAWLCALAYMVVWTTALVGEGTKLHPFMIGMFVLGVATRMPAAITEYRGYQSGTGDLNRIFLNNVLQVLICIPIPWLIYSLVNGGESVTLYSGVLIVLFLALFIMGSLVVIVFRSYDWLASKPVLYPIGAMLFFYILMAWLLEYSVLLSLNEDQCISP
jgi:hypothetical protein